MTGDPMNNMARALLLASNVPAKVIYVLEARNIPYNITAIENNTITLAIEEGRRGGYSLVASRLRPDVGCDRFNVACAFTMLSENGPSIRVEWEDLMSKESDDRSFEQLLDGMLDVGEQVLTEFEGVRYVSC